MMVQKAKKCKKTRGRGEKGVDVVDNFALGYGAKRYECFWGQRFEPK
jgi:hypothetical protein